MISDKVSEADNNAVDKKPTAYDSHVMLESRHVSKSVKQSTKKYTERISCTTATVNFNTIY